MEHLQKFGAWCKELVRRGIAYLASSLGSKGRFALYGSSLFSVFVLFFVAYAVLIRPPGDFSGHTLVKVAKGSSLATIAEQLKEQGIIQSPFWFRNIVILSSGQAGAVAGSYYFEKKASVFEVGRRIANGEYGLKPIRITVPEGTNAFELAKLYKQALGAFDEEKFIKLALEKEGYLFPDTYLFVPGVTPEEIVSVMEENFHKKTEQLATAVEKFGRTFHEVVTMASLLEEEARTLQTRRMIAGILWARLDIGMPLQVDAVFPYIIGKNTYEVSVDDLATDSPYNTYKYAGLPKGPITNPGLESLEAAVTPIQSNYVYYLSDRAGRMYYAETHDEHLFNKAMYLDQM